MNLKSLFAVSAIILIMAGCAAHKPKSSYNNHSAIWQDAKSHEALKQLNTQLPN